MTTTVAISDDVMIIKRQIEIFQDKWTKMKISNILEEAVRKGIEFVGKE